MSKAISAKRSEAVAKLLKESPLVILCGGHGTRLREETEWKPKPMVSVGDFPLLWHIMQYYACFGVRRFVLCLGYKGQVIRDFFIAYHQRHSDLKIELGKNDVTYPGDGYTGDDWEIVLANTGTDTHTGGRIAAVRKYLDSDNFLMTYGDGLADVDLNALVECHLQNNKLGTVTAVQPTSRFAELIIENETVNSFSEKPLITDGWVSGGFFVFKRDVLKYIHGDVVFEQEPLRELATAKQLSAYKHYGFWQCVDTYRELMMVEKMWQSDQAPWKKW
ncbi:MAG TPA: glucose-1-phosphate cytidylyltransferase [Planktothrix sp.]|jgi:glucose-1-phosphate cytidylyltransferase